MNIETLKAVKTIYVHGGGCPDGIASAILLHDALPSAKIRFVQYNSEEHLNLQAGPGVLFADFTMKEDQVKAFVDAGTIVLDHHKGAKDIVSAFGDNGRFGDEATEPGVCGAVLCYRHVWMPVMAAFGGPARDVGAAQALDFATLAGIRDTWQRKDPRWSEACAQAEMLRFFPEDRWLALERPFSRSHADLWDERRRVGAMLVEKHARSVKKTLEKSWRFKSAKGTRVTVFEGTSMSSDASDVAEETDLVIGLGFVIENGKQTMIFSTRTRGAYNCLALCKSFGGGGHSSAAGFSLDITERSLNPYQLAELLVNEHEAKS